jgi:4-amino-4-deoxy-L-arabinose transferase-like glycosyltransferase
MSPVRPEEAVPKIAARVCESALAPKNTLQNTWRRRWSFIGWVLLVFAQYLMLRQAPLVAISFSGREALDRLIGVPGLDNVILSSGLLVLGCCCLAGGVAPRWGKPQPFLTLPCSPRMLLARLRPIAWQLAGSSILFAFLIWQLSIRYYDSFLAAVWIGAIALLASAAWRLDQDTGAALSPAITWRDVALMLAMLLLGFAVSGYRLAQVPDSLIGDEGSFWEAARSLAIGEYRPNIFSLGVYSYPILSSIYQSWFLQVFGLSLWSWRFSSVVAMGLALPATYLFARELFGRRVATVAALVMAVTPYSIAFARLGYNNAQSLLPVALALYLLYAGLGRSSALYLCLSGVAAGVGFYTYTAGRLGFVVAVLALAYLLVALLARRARRGAPPAGSLGGLLVLGTFFGAGWFLTAFPLIFYAMGESPEAFNMKLVESILANVDYARTIFSDDQLFRDWPPIQMGTGTLFYRPDLYAYLLARGLIRSTLVFHNAGLLAEPYIKGPLTGPWAAVFYTGGVAAALSQLRQKKAGLLLLWLVAGVVLLSGITTFPPRQAHLVATIPAMAILIALGIVAMADYMGTYARFSRPPAQLALVAGCVTLMAYNGLGNYFVDVQAAYRPYQENIIAFAALSLAEPRQFVYVYADPAEKEFTPWAIREIPNQASYRAVSLEDLAKAQPVLDPGQPYTLFFRPEDEPLVRAYVRGTLKGTGIFTSYYNAERQTIFMSYTKT